MGNIQNHIDGRWVYVRRPVEEPMDRFWLRVGAFFLVESLRYQRKEMPIGKEGLGKPYDLFGGKVNPFRVRKACKKARAFLLNEQNRRILRQILEKDGNLDAHLKAMDDRRCNSEEILKEFAPLDEFVRLLGTRKDRLKMQLYNELEVETGLRKKPQGASGPGIVGLRPYTFYIEVLEGNEKGMLLMPIYEVLLSRDTTEAHIIECLDRAFRSRESEQAGYAWIRDPKMDPLYDGLSIQPSVGYLARRLSVDRRFEMPIRNERNGQTLGDLVVADTE